MIQCTGKILVNDWIKTAANTHKQSTYTDTNWRQNGKCISAYFVLLHDYILLSSMYAIMNQINDNKSVCIELPKFKAKTEI